MLYIIVYFLYFWYIYQRRELKRYFEKVDAEERERKAIEKEVELTNVLNLL